MKFACQEFATFRCVCGIFVCRFKDGDYVVNMSDSTVETNDDVEEDLATFDQIHTCCQRLRNQLGRVMVGQKTIIETLLAAMLCQGHVLIIGVPGLAKTLLVRTLASALDLTFKRIQFTPDMMPSDIVGTELIQEDPESGRRHLKFVPGPIFAQLILADEINRTPPRTQAALLEAMAERQVTVAGKTTKLQQPFVVVATQNPIEQEGTYPLPEAQLDRFLFGLWMDYPNKDEEITVVTDSERIQDEHIDAVLDHQKLARFNKIIRQMPVSQHVVDYAVSLVRATRPQEPQVPKATLQYVAWGAGPRAGQALILAAKALAAMDNHPTPSCEHVRRITMPVLRHRVIINYTATGEGKTPQDVVSEVLREVSEPKYSGD